MHPSFRVHFVSFLFKVYDAIIQLYLYIIQFSSMVLIVSLSLQCFCYWISVVLFIILLHRSFHFQLENLYCLLVLFSFPFWCWGFICFRTRSFIPFQLLVIVVLRCCPVISYCCCTSVLLPWPFSYNWKYPSLTG